MVPGGCRLITIKSSENPSEFSNSNEFDSYQINDLGTNDKTCIGSVLLKMDENGLTTMNKGKVNLQFTNSLNGASEYDRTILSTDFNVDKSANIYNYKTYIWY